MQPLILMLLPTKIRKEPAMKPSGYSTKQITVLALFTTIALAVYYAESLLPPIVPIPGIKLGLANIITLILIKKASIKDAFLVLLMRILIAGFLFGQAMSLLYSLTGGIFSLVSMYLIYKLLQGHFTFLTGIFGALFHNLGQLLVAMLLVSGTAPLAYLPFFILSSMITGTFTGLCAHYASKKLPTSLFSQKQDRPIQ